MVVLTFLTEDNDDDCMGTENVDEPNIVDDDDASLDVSQSTCFLWLRC